MAFKQPKSSSSTKVSVKWGSKDDNIQFAIIRGAELWWAKLDPKHPVEPFGTLQWEVQLRFPKSAVEEMEQFGTVKKCKEGKLYQLNLKKKAVKADGEPAKPIKVELKNEDGDLEEIDPRTIGNGSVGAVKIMLRDYQITGPKGKVTKEGTAITLHAVQLDEEGYIKYEPRDGGFDFDEEDEDEAPKKKSKAPVKKSKKVVEEDDDEDDEDEDEDEDDEPAPRKKAKPTPKKPVKTSSKRRAQEDDEEDDDEDDEDDL